MCYIVIMTSGEKTPNPEILFRPGAPAHAAFNYLAILGREVPDTPEGRTMWEVPIMADTGELSTPLNYALLYRQQVVGANGGLWAYLRVDVGSKMGYVPTWARRSSAHIVVGGLGNYEDDPMTNNAFMEDLRFVRDNLNLGRLPPFA